MDERMAQVLELFELLLGKLVDLVDTNSWNATPQNEKLSDIKDCLGQLNIAIELAKARQHDE